MKINLKKLDINNFLERNTKWIFIIFVILIIISRIYKFGELPTSVSVDEAGEAYDAFCLANYGVDRYLNSFPIYLINFGGGQSALYAYLNALLIKITQVDNIIITRLPELIFFILSILISYKLINKMHDKKTALLLAFLIIICPWHIVQSRIGLDCNLLGPLFILDLYLLENAKKNYQYILAGICLGITLYSYSLSYIIIPTFLLIWLIYKLYLKQIKFKQIVLIFIPILVFAIPLIYFLLLNRGIVSNSKFGLFTIPKLFLFRTNELSVSNIWECGIFSIENIFLEKNTLYPIDIPFFIIGLAVGIANTIETIKQKKYSFLTLMTLTFFAILIPNLLVYVGSTNRANILYIPILYFICIGLLEIIKRKKVLSVVIIAVYFVMFIRFEVYYYNEYANKTQGIYEDFSISKVYNFIKENNLEKNNIYFYTFEKSQPYIFIAINNKISPYEFHKIWEEKYKEKAYSYKQQYANYYFNDFDVKVNDENQVFVVNKNYKNVISSLEDENYNRNEIEEYSVFWKNNKT